MGRSSVFTKVSVWVPFQNPDDSGIIKREVSLFEAPGVGQSAPHPYVSAPAGEGEGVGDRGEGMQGPWATDRSWDVVCSREAH